MCASVNAAVEIVGCVCVCVNNSWCGGYGVCASVNADVDIVWCVSTTAGVEVMVVCISECCCGDCGVCV